MHKVFFHIVLWLMCVGVKQTIAQLAVTKFEQLSVDKGLSQATIRAILKDRRGFMWFGSQDGLNVYDGREIKVYRHDKEEPQSLSHNNVWCLMEGEDGKIWVGTRDGLNIFDPASEEFLVYKNDPNVDQGLSSSYIKKIIKDQKGRIWIATYGGGLNQYLGPDHFAHYRNDSDNPASLSEDRIWDILEDHAGYIWIATVNGLNQLNPNTGEVTRYLHDPNNPNSLSSNDLICLFEDSKKRLWIGTDTGGLNRLDLSTGKFSRFSHDPESQDSLMSDVIWSISEDPKGRIWLGNNSEGISVWTDSTQTFEHIPPQPGTTFGLPDGFIFSQYRDPQGILWLGTLTGGVVISDSRRWKFPHYQKRAISRISLQNNSVWSICEDSFGEVWVGTSTGLDRIHKDWNKITHYKHQYKNPMSISNGRIWALYNSSHGNIWVGTSTGLNFFDRQTEHFYKYQNDPNNPSSLCANSISTLFQAHGYLWVGTRNGLDLLSLREPFNPARSPTFIHVPADQGRGSLSGARIGCMYRGRDGTIWVGTEKGLNRLAPQDFSQPLNIQSLQFTNYVHLNDNSNSLSQNTVRCVWEDTNGILWIGTNEGLNRFDPNTDNWKVYLEEDGLANNVVYGILADNSGRLWMSTNKGISRFDPQTEEFRTYDTRDGLQSDEFNSNTFFKNDQGKLFFGGINGFNAFFPAQIQDNLDIPSLYFTDFQLFNESVEISPNGKLKQAISYLPELQLTHRDYVFSLRFAALNFTLPDKNQYAYILEGFDKDWNYVGNRNDAIYTNLDPGSYTFRVKASNNDGHWNETGLELPIYIEPPFWQEKWFLGALLLLILALIWLFIQWRTRSVLKQNERLELTVNRRTQEIRKQKEELQQAFKDLKEAQTRIISSEKMASLGLLTAGIAHEINNPVNFVSTNLQALKLDLEEMKILLTKVHQLKNGVDKEALIPEIIRLSERIDSEQLEEEIQELIGGMERGAHRTQEIVAGLRTFARSDADKFSLANIHEGIDSTLVILNSKLRDRIRVHKNYGNLPLVECLLGKLNQVFLNILDNAIQAIPGQGDIYISTFTEGDRAIIKLRDSGTGIPEEVQQKIFDPFFTTKGVGEGTGLGLSISYGIIEQHRGTIKVESQPGEGTTFILELPIRQSTPTTNPKKPQ